MERGTVLQPSRLLATEESPLRGTALSGTTLSAFKIHLVSILIELWSNCHCCAFNSVSPVLPNEPIAGSMHSEEVLWLFGIRFEFLA